MALPVRIERGQTADPLEMVRSDLGTILGRFFGGGLLGDGGESSAFASLANAVDIREDADHIYVVADLPGFRKEDIDISLENGTLTITAERREEITAEPQEGEQRQAGQRQGDQRQEGRQGQDQGQQVQGQQQRPTYLLRERRVQRFVRSFTLPPNVDEQHVQAKLENGVLTIVLNKREESKPKRVQVS
jgi:HSP20 family protein